MNIDNQKNGNNQLNSIRNEFNDRTKKKFFLGNSTRVYWSNHRRFRTILTKIACCFYSKFLNLLTKVFCMSSKFFGNRTEKHSIKKKGAKQKFNNKSNKAKSGGVRKVGRGG